MLGRGVGPKHAAGVAPENQREARAKKRGPAGRFVYTAVLTVSFACAFLIISASMTRLSADYADGVRTEAMRTLQNAERVWRRAAWQQDDYLSQIRLGDLYSQNQSFPQGETPSNKSFDDPVEAYVWYYLALRPGHIYPGTYGDASSTLATIRNNALNNIDRIHASLSFDQRLDARGRIIYILASRGADGFMTLGRLHRASPPCPLNYGLNAPPYCHSQPSPTGQPCACRNSNFVMHHSWPLSWWYALTRWFYKDPDAPVCTWKSAQELQSQNPADPNPYVPIDDFNANSPIPGICPTDQTGYSSPDMSRASMSPSPSVSRAGADSGAISMTPSDNGVGSGYSSGGPSGYYGNAAGNSYSSSSSYGGGYSSGYAGGGGSGFGDDADVSDDAGSGYYGASSPGSSYYNVYPIRRPPSVFTRSDAEALMYFKIAERLRQPLAPAYVNDLTQAIKYNYEDSQKIIQEAEDRGRNWAPPFEYYPGAIAGGSIHSDESPVQLEQQVALQRVDEIPYPIIEHILATRLFVPHTPCAGRPFCPNPAVAKFQEAIGDPQTGIFTPQQIVRLIQMSAVDGRSDAQNTLGIMYAKGIGVPRNYRRAEQWFIKAARQQNVEAYRNLMLLYQKAPQGIEVNDDKIARFQGEKQRILQSRGWGVLRDEDIVAAVEPDVPKSNGPGQPDGAKR